MRLTVFSYQSQGLRDEQEDRILALPEAGLYAVMDGLGGHEDGARAAQTAADVLRAGASVAPSLETLRALFAAAHEQVAALAPCPVSEPGSHRRSCGCHRLPATTCTALWLAGERGYVGHVGDTRLWRVRRVTNGTAEQLTVDHHDGWFLLRSLGGKMEDPPELFEIEVKPGDTYLLCSDGVHLDGPEIAEIVACELLETAAQRLVARGMERYAAKTPEDGQRFGSCHQSRAMSNTTHGRSGTAHYAAWRAMIARCTDPKHESYHLYGGRGVTVCERWRSSFEAYLADVGERPPKHSLDRIDNNRGYEPGNVRWATPAEQARNRRDNRLIAYQGETLCMKDWARRLGIPETTLRNRIRRGMSPEAAFTTPRAGKAQTHCSKGHPFNASNTKVNSFGRRICRTCRREVQHQNNKKRWARHKEEAARNASVVLVRVEETAP